MKSIKLAVASCRVNATTPLPHHRSGVGGEYLNRTEYQGPRMGYLGREGKYVPYPAHERCFLRYEVIHGKPTY